MIICRKQPPSTLTREPDIKVAAEHDVNYLITVFCVVHIRFGAVLLVLAQSSRSCGDAGGGKQQGSRKCSKPGCRGASAASHRGTDWEIGRQQC